MINVQNLSPELCMEMRHTFEHGYTMSRFIPNPEAIRSYPGNLIFREGGRKYITTRAGKIMIGPSFNKNLSEQPTHAMIAEAANLAPEDGFDKGEFFVCLLAIPSKFYRNQGAGSDIRDYSFWHEAFLLAQDRRQGPKDLLIGPDFMQDLAITAELSVPVLTQAGLELSGKNPFFHDGVFLGTTSLASGYEHPDYSRISIARLV